MTNKGDSTFREKWGTRIGFLLAAAGWSIGLGNIWRFPYVTGKYGGGAFVLLYLVSLIVIAVPLFIIEFSLGRESKSSITTGFKKLAPKKIWFFGGWFGILGTILIFAYYTMLISWVIAYLIKTIKGRYIGMTTDQVESLFSDFTTKSGEVFLWQIAAYVVLGIIVSRGIVRGVEAFNKIAMPILFLILLGLGVYSLTLPGALKGLEFYLKPDFSKITGEAVLAAIGQVFLSVGVGFGATWVYGSYLGKKSDIPGDSIKVAALDSIGALLAGFIIFPAAFAFGVHPDVGQRLLFVTLPNVFGKMSGGVVFGTLFFFLVLVAALTSVIASTECIASWIMDELNLDRAKSRVRVVWLTLLGCFLLGIPIVLSQGSWSDVKLFGLDIFGIVDYVSANILLVLSGLTMSLFVGWFIGTKKFMKMANLGARGVVVKPFWGILYKFIIPAIILVLLLGKIFEGKF